MKYDQSGAIATELECKSVSVLYKTQPKFGFTKEILHLLENVKLGNSVIKASWTYPAKMNYTLVSKANEIA